MTTAFPASPGHLLIVARKRKGKVETDLVPIVGWAHLTGSMVHPLTTFNSSATTGYKAVLHPGGEVSDANKLKAFPTIEDWLAVVDADLPSPEESKPAPKVETKVEPAPEAEPAEIEPALPPVGPAVGVSGEKPAPKEPAAEKPKRTRKAKAEPEAAAPDPADNFDDLI